MLERREGRREEEEGLGRLYRGGGGRGLQGLTVSKVVFLGRWRNAFPRWSRFGA